MIAYINRIKPSKSAAIEQIEIYSESKYGQNKLDDIETWPKANAWRIL